MNYYHTLQKMQEIESSIIKYNQFKRQGRDTSNELKSFENKQEELINLLRKEYPGRDKQGKDAADYLYEIIDSLHQHYSKPPEEQNQKAKKPLSNEGLDLEKSLPQDLMEIGSFSTMGFNQSRYRKFLMYTKLAALMESQTTADEFYAEKAAHKLSVTFEEVKDFQNYILSQIHLKENNDIFKSACDYEFSTELWNEQQLAQWRAIIRRNAKDEGKMKTLLFDISPFFPKISERWGNKLTSNCNITDLEREVAKIYYKENGEKYPEAAILYKSYKLTPSEFQVYVNIIERGRLRESKNIPLVSIRGEGDLANFIIYRLDPKDPIAGILGKVTACCQSIGSDGAACAIHGMTNDDGGFYILRKVDKEKKRSKFENPRGIWAQCWAWRVGDNIVFDSIEGQKNIFSVEENAIKISKMYTLLAKKLVEEHNIAQVNVGIGSNTPSSIGFGMEGKNQAPQDYSYADSVVQRIIYDKEFPLCGEILLDPIGAVEKFWSLPKIKRDTYDIELFCKRLCEVNNVPAVRRFLNYWYKADPNVDLWNLNQPLIWHAIINTQVDLVDEVLEKGGEINFSFDMADYDAKIYPTGYTPLMLAVERGNDDMVEKILQHQPVLDTTNDKDKNALDLAAINGNLTILQKLLNTRGYTKEDMTMALNYVITQLNSSISQPQNYSKIIELLIKNGAVLEKSLIVRTTPNISILQFLSGSGEEEKKEYAKFLIEQESVTNLEPFIKEMAIDINWHYEENSTLLILAAQKGNLDMMKSLLKCNADLDAADANGFTALMYAAGLGNKAMVQLLLERGADPDAKSLENKTILSMVKNNEMEIEDPTIIELIKYYHKAAKKPISSDEKRKPLAFSSSTKNKISKEENKENRTLKKSLPSDKKKGLS